MERSARKLLITGVSGYVGRAVAPPAAAAFASVTGTYHRHAPAASPEGVTLTPAAIEEIPALIRALRPDVVLHTAAAWRTEEEARAVIVEGTRGIALACAETGVRLVHLSTDLVFDGERGPYAEDDPPAPVNFYGAAKAEAERIVAEVFSRADEGRPSTPFHSAQDGPALPRGAVIVRTSLVTCFDPPDPRTAPVLAALRGEAAAVTLFTDEYRCPVRTEDLAAALIELAQSDFAGVLHVAGPERLSRYELGLRIAAYYGLNPAAGIRPGLSSDSGMARPRDCSLRIDLARRVLRASLHPLPKP
ncbi:MAG: SDR family oxidoreductase [Anaerolineae bacterium]|nr:SDR family oxidoreductase [Anaerolineae bacterium]